MKLEEMTIDLEQHIEVKADIGDVFKGVLYRFGEGSTNRTESRCDDSGAVARRPMVPRSRQWHRAPLGPCAGDQAAGSAGAQRSYVHVLPGLEPCRNPSDQVAGGTKVTLRHRAMGFLDPAHRRASLKLGALSRSIGRDFSGAVVANRA